MKYKDFNNENKKYVYTKATNKKKHSPNLNKIIPTKVDSKIAIRYIRFKASSCY
jgi:hypothetical protein